MGDETVNDSGQPRLLKALWRRRALMLASVVGFVIVGLLYLAAAGPALVVVVRPTAPHADADAEAAQNRIAHLQKDVSEAERAVADFSAANADAGSDPAQARVDNLTAQLPVLVERASQTDSAYRRALAAGTSPQGLISLSQLASSPTVERLRGDYERRVSALASAQARYGPKHPRLLRIAGELEQVEALMRGEAERIAGTLKADRDAAQQALADAMSEIGALQAQTNPSLQLRQLESAVETARAALRQAQQEAAAATVMQDQPVPAAPPPPIGPNPAVVLGVAVVAGLIIGAVAALVLEMPRGPAPAAAANMAQAVPAPPPQAAAKPARRPPARRPAIDPQPRARTAADEAAVRQAIAELRRGKASPDLS